MAMSNEDFMYDHRLHSLLQFAMSMLMILAHRDEPTLYTLLVIAPCWAVTLREPHSRIQSVLKGGLLEQMQEPPYF